MKKSLLILLGVFVISCSSVKKRNIINPVIKPSKNALILKGNVDCPSEVFEFPNGDNGVNFNKSICSLFEKELDSIGNNVFWYMQWNKIGEKFYPSSTMINIYDKDKLMFDRSMSFKTGPWVSDEEKFKKSLYYRIGEIIPTFDINNTNDSISKIEVFLNIKKD